MIKEENKLPIHRNDLICNYPYFAVKDENGRIASVFIMVAGDLADSSKSMTYFVVDADGTCGTTKIGKNRTFNNCFPNEQSIYAIKNEANIKITEIICNLS